MKTKLTILFSLFVLFLQAQNFAPQVGILGTTAMYKNDNRFVEWASSVTVTRGYLDIAFPDNGFVDYGLENNALGQPNNSVVSLGDAGEAVIQFNHAITNGQGADFAIFENGFLQEEGSEMAFLEFAFVEVSTDGVEYVRFPATSETPTDLQTDSFGFTNARNVHNLAGKYIANYGTPFDLEDLNNLTQGTTVNLNNINYIKLIDVVGTVNPSFAMYDSQNNIINDPYPTAFSSGGFDLDAVGVIHNTTTTAINDTYTSNLSVYPNPVTDVLKIRTTQKIIRMKLFSVTGKALQITDNSTILNMKYFDKGVYFLHVKTNRETKIFKVIKQ